MSNSEAVVANASSTSGSASAFTSFTSTRNDTVAPPPSSSPNRSGSVPSNARMSPAFAPVSRASKVSPSSSEPTLYR